MKRLLLPLLVLGVLTARAQPATEDAILIVAISPETFVDGQETRVTVEVAYNLVSSEEGIIDLNSNELRAQAFSPFAHLRVKKGNSTASISGTMTPRYWTALAPARLAVFLFHAADDLLQQRQILANDETAIAVAKPNQRPETRPENPNPSDIYEDTVVIKAVAPQTLTAGVETDVTVTVAYELFSREAGQINLGYSEGRGNGYKIVGSTVVKIGSGEATLQARIVPVKTGALPFTKIFVNLSEYPHRKTWSPLAGDPEVMEVH